MEWHPYQSGSYDDNDISSTVECCSKSGDFKILLEIYVAPKLLIMNLVFLQQLDKSVSFLVGELMITFLNFFFFC